MLAEVYDVKDNEIDVKILDEDISVLYIIQHELLKEKSVEFAGVSLQHPLVREYILRTITKRKDPIEAVQDSSVSAFEYSKGLAAILKSALKK